MVLTYLPNEVAHQWLQWGKDKPTAAHWHSTRRAAILKRHPEVARLMTPEPLTPVVMAGLAAGHVTMAYALRNSSWLTVVAASATIGGLIAFDIQALNHELCHQRSPSSRTIAQAWRGISQQPLQALSTWIDVTLCNKYVSSVMALLGSACTTVPWFSYYHQGGHQLHHLHAGTPYDNDGQAFFWAWEKVPLQILDNPLGVVLWTSTVAVLLPVFYFGSLGTWFFYFPLSNLREMCYAMVDLAATTAVYNTVHSLAGVKGLAYLGLSTAFSMGLAGHPLLAFWIAQHVCESPPSLNGDIMSADEHRYLWSHVEDTWQPSYQFTAQPTLSYYGSVGLHCIFHAVLLGFKLARYRSVAELLSVLRRVCSFACAGCYLSPSLTIITCHSSSLWNWLTMNELLHVEHHDFQHIPWTKTPQLSRLAPEFYLPSAEAPLVTQQAPCYCARRGGDADKTQCSCSVLQRYQQQQARPWLAWETIPSTPQPMRCIPRLVQDLWWPYFMLRGNKFDFACRHALLHHAATRKSIAVHIMDQLDLRPDSEEL